ncbi:MAG: hypothetical protein L0229_08120 [Blastocatellia bacterium]|nr:hypothetical protein [Blastocatellia bacterium]
MVRVERPLVDPRTYRATDPEAASTAGRRMSQTFQDAPGARRKKSLPSAASRPVREEMLKNLEAESPDLFELYISLPVPAIDKYLLHEMSYLFL